MTASFDRGSTVDDSDLAFVGPSPRAARRVFLKAVHPTTREIEMVGGGACCACALRIALPRRSSHLVAVRPFHFFVALLVILVCGCATVARHPPQDPSVLENEDHTIASISSLSEFEKYAAPHPGTRELKFIVPYFSDPEYRHVRFLDANFYWFHDEWYWYQLLRGMRVPADTLTPGKDYGFSNPGEAAEWASREESLPLGLSMVEKRLYSRRFYDLALGRRPRAFGLGSVFHVPARSTPEKAEEVWAFQLEYIDDARPEDLKVYFSLLRNALPAEVAKKLVFVARSPKQHDLIKNLEAKKHELAPYLKTYSDLVTPGAIEIYSDGLTAGYLRIIEEGQLSSVTSSPSDILVLPQVPDELPAAAGIITAVPQTPLSHINLLAQNRGIPNLYMGEADKNAQLRQLAHDEMPVVMYAQGNSFVIQALDEGVYKQWLALGQGKSRSLPAISAGALPYFEDLKASDFSRVEEVSRSAGGKAAGYLLLAASGVEIPTPAIALTTRAFSEHLSRLEPLVTTALTDPEFLNSDHIRYLALEGPKAYTARFGEQNARTFLAAFHRQHSSGPLAALVSRGGLRQAIRDLPLDPPVLEHITGRLRARFSTLAPDQGLRFRSSSNVEDIEGFNGAGLYESHTGFLSAEKGAGESLDVTEKRKKTIESAIKKTWASFFSFAAFEERSNEGINPLGGGMGVLIHPRFDDEQELSNGVCTLKIDRGAPLSSGRPRYEMLVNVQRGATSVTNAESGVVPEVIRLRAWEEGNGNIEFQYISAATGRDEEERALNEEQLRALFRDVRQVGDLWLTQKNRSARPGQERRGVVLDFEFRTMDSGWPRSKTKQEPKPRLILKQVRPLEPSPPPLPEAFENAPIPGELLARAVRIERVECQSQSARVQVLRVFTDKTSPHDFGYAREPFVAELVVKRQPGVPTDVPSASLTYRELRQTDAVPTMGTSTVTEPEKGFRVRIAKTTSSILEAYASGDRLKLLGPAGVIVDEPASCRPLPILDHPDRLLREAIEGR